MSEPLYLKYRPQKLSELVGQDVIATTLSNAIGLNKIAHAYFFTGPRGCGKTSTARILAKSLNCKNGPTVHPCGVCDNCREIAQGISPDVIEIDAASHRSVEDAAQVIERCHLASQTAQYKIYILDEVHMLSKEAFNALLKTIEEPPPNVIFVLATTEEHKVPPTIVSRCQKFSFRPIEHAPLVNRLKNVAEIEQINLSESSFNRIAKQSRGGLRDALSILDQVSILAPPGEAIEEKLILDLFGALSEDGLKSLLSSLIERDSLKVLEQTNNFLKEGVDPLQLLRNLIEFSIDRLEESIKDTKAAQEIIRAIDGLNKAEYSLRNASQPIIKLKSSILGICVGEESAASSLNLDGLVKRIENLEKQFQRVSLESLEKAEFVSGKTSQSNSQNNEKPVIASSEPTKEKGLQEPNFIQTQPSARPLEERQQPEDKANGLVNILLANLTHTPTKALIKDAKVFVLSESDNSVVFGVPQKTFFDKLSDSKKVSIIKNTLEDSLGKSYTVRFELSGNPQGISSLESPQHTIKEQSEAKKKVVSIEADEENILEEPAVAEERPVRTEPKPEEPAELPQLLNRLTEQERAIFEVASHILGAKPIKRK